MKIEMRDKAIRYNERNIPSERNTGVDTLEADMKRIDVIAGWDPADIDKRREEGIENMHTVLLNRGHFTITELLEKQEFEKNRTEPELIIVNRSGRQIGNPVPLKKYLEHIGEKNLREAAEHGKMCAAFPEAVYEKKDGEIHYRGSLFLEEDRSITVVEKEEREKAKAVLNKETAKEPEKVAPDHSAEKEAQLKDAQEYVRAANQETFLGNGDGDEYQKDFIVTDPSQAKEGRAFEQQEGLKHDASENSDKRIDRTITMKELWKGQDEPSLEVSDNGDSVVATASGENAQERAEEAASRAAAEKNEEELDDDIGMDRLPGEINWWE